MSYGDFSDTYYDFLPDSEKYVVLELPIGEWNEAYARMAVSVFASCLSPSFDELDNIKAAVEEALTNCNIHAYPDGDGIIKLTSLIKDNDLHIVVEDFGVGIEDIDEAMQPLYTSRPDLKRSGMGFSFMQAYMDSVTVESAPDAGTLVYMRKTVTG